MRILVADDHEAIRAAVIRVLQSRADVEECLEAIDGKEAVEKAIAWKPKLVLLDILSLAKTLAHWRINGLHKVL
jgi:chemotaxis response regulator CheB